jgi:hypothetical protein
MDLFKQKVFLIFFETNHFYEWQTLWERDLLNIFSEWIVRSLNASVSYIWFWRLSRENLFIHSFDKHLFHFSNNRKQFYKKAVFSLHLSGKQLLNCILCHFRWYAEKKSLIRVEKKHINWTSIIPKGFTFHSISWI